MSSIPPLAVFDLDGTLVDSLPDLAECGNELRASYGLPEVSEAAIRRMIGDGVALLVDRLLAGSEIDRAEAVSRYMGFYTPRATRLTRLFPGAQAALHQLQESGWRLAVCTNKPVEAARDILERFGIAEMLSAIGGGDSFNVRKPDPGHLLGTIALAGADAARCVMVGDHANDINAARGAGAASIFASWGYGLPEMGDGASARAAACADVPALAEQLLAGVV